MTTINIESAFNPSRFELFEYIEIEELLGYKLEQFEPIKEKVVAFKYEVIDALKAAKIVSTTLCDINDCKSLTFLISNFWKCLPF